MGVREQLREYLFGTLIPTERSNWPPDDASLAEAGLDSLRLMQMLVFVEEKLKVVLPDHEVTPQRTQSVNSVVAWIESHRGK